MDFLHIKNLKDYREKLIRHPTKQYPQRPLSAITHIAIHHSATKTGSAEAYARYHVKELGWPGIGYHFVIEKDGTIKWANNPEVQCYHVGSSNKMSIGICLTGDFRVDGPTSHQRDSLFNLLKYLLLEFNLGPGQVWGHNQFSGSGNKSCPCIDMVQIRAQLKKPEMVKFELNDPVPEKSNWKQEITTRFPDTSRGELRKLNPTLPDNVPPNTPVKIYGEPEKVPEEVLRLIRSMENKRYVVLGNEKKDLNLNIVGIRNSSSLPDKFDDRIVVFWRYENKWNVKQYKATTKPGLAYLNQPISDDGTAILKEGQYLGAYNLGLHKGKYKALVQAAPVTVIRDFDRDSNFDFVSGREQTGFFGINIHRATASGESTIVGKWSAGCQVFANSAQFDEFIDICGNSALNWGNSFTYTLLNNTDLI